MFVGLSIRNVVLIEQLALTFRDGLTVLTGETGAGKSILLDALGLALGARGDAALVRTGAETASVAAEFALPASHPVRGLLRESDIEVPDDTIILRRTLQADGRTRAHIADQPVSVGLLRQVGSALVEIHGQFDTQGLLDPRTHRGVLDAFAGNEAVVDAVRSAWTLRRDRERALDALRDAAATAAGEAELLRHAVDELARLAPEPDEEARLAERRALLQQAGRLIEAIGTALGDLDGDRGAEHGLASAQRTLYRLADRARGRFDAALEAIGRALDATAEADQALQRLTSELDFDSDALERLEDRLFTLRAAARKHGVSVDELAAVGTDLAARLAAIEGRDDAIARLEDEVRAARAAWAEAAGALSATRRQAAAALDEAVSAELAPLHLGRARFATDLAPLEDGGADGAEAVTFTVSTNPDMPPGPLNRIASGGELARFMLALKLVLARRAGRSEAVPAMVFDEVDSGVGGAVAEAVGARLRRLGATVQVFAVTHNPQVAARAHRHLRVEKQVGPSGTSSTVVPLDATGRREEIARMLSGARVTDEARAAADALIAGDG